MNINLNKVTPTDPQSATMNNNPGSVPEQLEGPPSSLPALRNLSSVSLERPPLPPTPPAPATGQGLSESQHERGRSTPDAQNGLSTAEDRQAIPALGIQESRVPTTGQKSDTARAERTASNKGEEADSNDRPSPSEPGVSSRQPADLPPSAAAPPPTPRTVNFAASAASALSTTEQPTNQPMSGNFGMSTAKRMSVAKTQLDTERKENQKKREEERNRVKKNAERIANQKQKEDWEREKNPPFWDWKLMLIDQRSKFMTRWDLFVTGLLIYTAILTPYEVAFLEPAWNGLFWFNRIVDLLFFTDTVFQFLLPFKNKHGLLVTRHSEIALNYLKSWFTIDIVSVIPFDFITLTSSSSDEAGGGGGENKQIMRLTRMVRATKLVRMVSRLLRMARGSRLFKRWEAKLSINYAMMNLHALMIGLAAWSHWAACIWGMTMDLENASWSASFKWMDDDNLQPGDMYFSCLHWSLGKVTGMGEGDALLTQTTVQRAVMCVLNITFGVANAYLIGGVVGILERMNERMAEFFSSMDTLNQFLKKKKFVEGEMSLNGKTMSGQKLCETLRAYYIFKHSQGSLEEGFLNILQNCSPYMQTAIALKLHSYRLLQVPYLATASDQLITALSVKFKTQVVAREELVYHSSSHCTDMYWVDVGKVLVRASVKRVHDFFGEEIFYKQETEVRGYAAVALMECVLHCVRKKDLQAVVMEYGGAKMRACMKGLGLILKSFLATRRAGHHAVRSRDFHSGFEMLKQQYRDFDLLTPRNPIVWMWKSRIYQILSTPEKKSPPEDPEEEEADLTLQLKGKSPKSMLKTKFKKHALKMAADAYFAKMDAYVDSLAAKKLKEAQERRRTGGVSTVDTLFSEDVVRSGVEGLAAASGRTMEQVLDNPALFSSRSPMSKYKPLIVEEHEITVARMQWLSPSDLVAIGVKLGDAADIINACKKGLQAQNTEMHVPDLRAL